jgi:asparagine synthase (glutamine-hydrolysing)
MGSWIRNDLGPLVDNLLSREQVKRRGLFNSAAVGDIVAKHKAQKSDYTDQLLALINLELWCQIFLDRKQHHEVLDMMAAV